MEKGTKFSGSESVDVVTALEMIRVGIAPTTELSPVGTVVYLHGDIPVTCKGQRTRGQFLARIKELGLSVDDFSQCPKDMLFEAIEAVHGTQPD